MTLPLSRSGSPSEPQLSPRDGDTQVGQGDGAHDRGGGGVKGFRPLTALFRYIAAGSGCGIRRQGTSTRTCRRMKGHPPASLSSYGLSFGACSRHAST